MKQKGILACITVMFLFLLSVVPSVQVEENKRAIRVGFLTQPGLTVKNDDGTCTGYTYDYLKRISQYTGQTYEFVEIKGDLNEQLTTMLGTLKKGDLDLLGAMSYSEGLSKIYGYPTGDYGNAYSVITVLSSDERLDEYNLAEGKSFRIALDEDAENRNITFEQPVELNDMKYKTVWCESAKEQQKTVESKKTDALITIDPSVGDNFRSIAKFSPTSLYFATIKGNSALVSELNQAIVGISEVNSTLQSTLYNRCFTKSSNQLLLNSREKAYINEHPALEVLVQDGFRPL